MRIPFKILVIKNRLKVDISDDLDDLKNYVEARTPFEIDYTYLETDLDLKHKPFGISYVTNGKSVELWGLDGIKDQLRKDKVVPEYWYHSAFFFYDLKDTGFENLESLGHWTYFENIVPGTEFTEVATSSEWDRIDDVFRVASHEIFHVWHNRARRYGIPTIDTMDVYDLEFEPYATVGNRARNLIALSPHWDEIGEQPLLKMILKFITDSIASIRLQIQKLTMNQVPITPAPEPSRLEKWAEAIKLHEGWFVGSRSHRNNNPGNIKFVGQKLAIGSDDANFAIFKTYADGWETLVGMLRRAATGGSLIYKPSMTLLQFFQKYAPAADSNNPLTYAKFVAGHIGVTVDTPISDLV